MHPFMDVITVKVDILVNLALLTDGIQSTEINPVCSRSARSTRCL